MGLVGGHRRTRGLARSMATAAALTLEEVLDGTEGATVPLAPWRRRCRRLLRRVVSGY